MNQEEANQGLKKEGMSDEAQSLEAARRLRPLVITTSVISIVSSIFFLIGVLNNNGSPDSQYYLLNIGLILGIYCFLGVPLAVLVFGILTIVKGTKIRPPYNSLAISSRIGAIVLLLEPPVTILGLLLLYTNPLLMTVSTSIVLIAFLVLSIWSLAFFCSRLSEALRISEYTLPGDNDFRSKNMQQYKVAASTNAPTVQSNHPLDSGKPKK